MSIVATKENIHRQRRPLSIRQALFLSIALTAASTILVAVVLHGHKLQKAHQVVQCERAQAVAEVYAVQLESLPVDKYPQHLQNQLRSLAKHPNIELLAVTDNKFTPLAVKGKTKLLQCFFQPQISNTLGKDTKTWLAQPKQSTGNPLVLVSIPLQSGSPPKERYILLCAMNSTNQTLVSALKEGTYLFILLTVAGLGVLLGFWYLNQSVLKPLTTLTQYKKATHKPAYQTQTLERSDEIGDLARVLSEMYENLDHWKKQIDEMEKNVTDRVAARTRQIARQLHQTEQKAWTDTLTRLGNRQLFEDKFADIFRAQKQAGQDLSLVLIDIDNFKNLNDSLGHQAGDRLLQFVGELLNQCLREQDLAIRYGGDEFLLILPGVPATGALKIAERTVRMFAQQSKLLNVEPAPSMSAGIASLKKHHPNSIAQFMELADRALYETKNTGKSDVRIYESDNGPSLRH